MVNRSELFRVCCTFFFIWLTILVSSPLATLTFSEENLIDHEQLSTGQVEPAPPIIVKFLNSGEHLELPLDNHPVYDLYTTRELQAQGLPMSLPAVQPYYNEKVVYLTFDDGPDSINTPIVLDILKENKIAATFFLVGKQAEQNPDILKRIYQEGHAIGNHTYDHIYNNLYRSPSTYMEQLHHTDEIIKNTLGCRPRISRAPGGSVGSFTKGYWDLLKSEGYIEVGWNISSGDASQATSSQIFSNIKRQIDSNKHLWSHAIVLMHDGRGHTETLKALPDIIRYFKEIGFEFRVINLETPSAW